MKLDESNEREFRRYLLGEVPEELLQQVEERLMTDTEYYDELMMVEDELVDDYLQGNLSSEEKERFMSNFPCTPERRDKLAFAEALTQYLSSPAARRSSESARGESQAGTFWQWLTGPPRGPVAAWLSLAASLFLLMLVGVWSMVRIGGLQNQVGEIVAEQAVLHGREQGLRVQLAEAQARNAELAKGLRQEQGKRASLERDLASTDPRPSAPTLASFLLTPGLVRDMGNTKRVMIPSGSVLVQLQLDLGMDDYPRYRAALHEAEGDEIWVQNKVKAERIDNREVVVLTLPPNLLPRGDYYLKLSGITDGGDLEAFGRYDFRVLTQ